MRSVHSAATTATRGERFRAGVIKQSRESARLRLRHLPLARFTPPIKRRSLVRGLGAGRAHDPRRSRTIHHSPLADVHFKVEIFTVLMLNRQVIYLLPWTKYDVTNFTFCFFLPFKYETPNEN